ncbi:S9 family peptidase [Chitinophagaceae bacterium LWZ2-11]
MKSIRFALLCLFVSICCFSIAQKSIKWSKDGSSYYTTENGEIVKYELPSFNKTTVVSSKLLIPAGQSKALSVRSYSFSEDGKKILIYTNSKKVWRYDTRGDYWLLNLNNNSLIQLGKGRPASSLMFAKFSPDGTKVAYVSEHNIYTEDLAIGKITQLTKDGTARIINGTFDWVYEEEFGCRDGFRWSPDSKSIAFWQIDATKIRNFLLINNTDSIYSFTIPVEYPKVGEDPSSCKVGVITVASGKIEWMKVPGDAVQHYIPRMEWAATGNDLIIQQLNRKQNESNLIILNAATGNAQTIHTEKNDSWIDVEDVFSAAFAGSTMSGWRWIHGGKDFLWISEKDGWRHIYLISKDGKKETLLTKGNFDIIDLTATDEKGGYVYFTASPNNATQQYLYRTTLDGNGQPELLSPANEKGTHDYQIAPGAAYAQHTFSNANTSPSNSWVKLPTHEVIKEVGPKGQPTGGTKSEFIQVTTEDNVTMDGWMIKPANFDSTKKYPVVFYVYTEPGSATVKDTYGTTGTFLYVGDASKDGYIQISLDGRGTPAPKGAAWRKSIYRKVGILNVHDQAMAAKKISQWSFVDTSRIAVWGWSGGGSTTLNLMFQYPDIYKTGIAIAPVASRFTYDDIYEERYMGLPQENRDDFVQASAITHAKGLKGNLLVVHGTGDDNVHYQNTELLINELVKYGKQFQMMSYPNRTHSISEGPGTFMHLANLFTNYLKSHCAPGGR